MKITQERRERIYRAITCDVPMLTSLAKTQALHAFAKTTINPMVREAVDNFADHLERMADDAPEFADALHDLFDHEALSDSGLMDEPVSAVMAWIHDHSAGMF